MTTAPVVTTAERLVTFAHEFGYLVERHDLPAPKDTRVRTYDDVQADVALANLHDLNLWAAATDAVITSAAIYHGHHYGACTVLGDVPLRLTCFGEALTP